MKFTSKFLLILPIMTFCTSTSFAASNIELSQQAYELHHYISNIANSEPKAACHNDVRYAAVLANDASISFSQNNRGAGKEKLYATAHKLEKAEVNGLCIRKSEITNTKYEAYRIIKLI